MGVSPSWKYLSLLLGVLYFGVVTITVAGDEITVDADGWSHRVGERCFVDHNDGESLSGGGRRVAYEPYTGHSMSLGLRHAVSAPTTSASYVASQILEKGGSAVDAAIAANAVTSVIDPIA